MGEKSVSEKIVDTALKTLQTIPGVGPATAKRLIENGYLSIEDVASARPEDLRYIFGSAKKAKQVIMAARELIYDRETYAVKAEELESKRLSKLRIIPTGCKALDQILGGGFSSDAVTLIAGPFSSGKTEMCFSACVNCWLLLGLDAVYIETEPGTFHLSRIREIAEERVKQIAKDEVLLKVYGLDLAVLKERLDSIGQHIWVVSSDKARTPSLLHVSYGWVMRKAREGLFKPGVVVVDSFSAPFRATYSGRDMLPDRNAEIARHFGTLQEIADELNAAVLLTAQVYGIPDAGGAKFQALVEFGMDHAIWGGEYMLHAATYILIVRRHKSGDICEAILIDSSHLPRARCDFRITRAGVSDVK